MLSISYKDPYTPLLKTEQQPYTLITPTSSHTYTPSAPIFPATDHIVDIQTGATFTAALAASGKIEIHGRAPFPAPTQKAKAIAAGAAHLATIDVSGAAHIHSTNHIQIHLSLTLPAPATAVAACGNRTAFLLANGKVAEYTQPTAQPAILNTEAKAIATGARFTAILTTTGTIFLHGQHPAGTSTYDIPTALQEISTSVKQIAASDRTLVALTDAGEVWQITPRETALVPCLSATAVAAGSSHVAALLADGSVFISGRRQPLSPHAPASTYVKIAASGQNTFLTRDDGTVDAVGFHGYGELCTGKPAYFTTPVQIPTATNPTNLTGSANSTVIHYPAPAPLQTLGSSLPTAIPYKATLTDTILQITGNSRDIPPGTHENIAKISAGPYHMFLFKTDGQVEAMGLNMNGQLGDGTTQSRPKPVPVPAFAGATHIACGFNHTVALFPDGTAKACGSNLFGQIGAATLSEQNPVLTLITSESLPGKAKSVTCGMNHTAILLEDGQVLGLGSNMAGQLGPWPTHTHQPTAIHVPAQLAEGLYTVKTAADSQTIAVPDFVTGIELDSKMLSWKTLSTAQTDSQTPAQPPPQTILLFGRYPNFANPDKKSVILIKTQKSSHPILAPFIRIAHCHQNKIYWHPTTYKANVEFPTPSPTTYNPDAETITDTGDFFWHIGQKPSPKRCFQQAEPDQPYMEVAVTEPVLDQEITDIQLHEQILTWSTAEPSYFDIYKSINSGPYTLEARKYSPTYTDTTLSIQTTDLVAYRIACGTYISPPHFNRPTKLGDPAESILVGDGYLFYTGNYPDVETICAYPAIDAEPAPPIKSSPPFLPGLTNGIPYHVYLVTPAQVIYFPYTTFTPIPLPPVITNVETDLGSVALSWQHLLPASQPAQPAHLLSPSYRVTEQSTDRVWHTTATTIEMTGLPSTHPLTFKVIPILAVSIELTAVSSPPIQALPAPPSNLIPTLLPTMSHATLTWQCQGKHLTATLQIGKNEPTIITQPYKIPVNLNPSTHLPIRLTIANDAGTVQADLTLSPPPPLSPQTLSLNTNRLSWQPAADSISDYVVKINGCHHQTLSQGQTSCEVVYSTQKKTAFTVTAVNTAGEATATYTYYPPPPTRPKITQAKSHQHGTALIHFEAEPDGTYACRLSTADEADQIHKITNSPYEVTTLTPDKIYTATIIIENEAGTAESDPMTIYPPPPGEPTEQKINFQFTTATITWKPAAYATMYKIKINDSIYTTHSTEIQVRQLEPNTNHTLQVTAVSAYGETAGPMTAFGPESPTAPQPFFESPTRLIWQQRMYAIYTLIIDDKAVETNIKSPYILKEFTQAQIRIRAENVNGSATSEPIQAEMPPPSPIRITSITYHDSYPVIEWSESEWPAEYAVILDDIEIATTAASPFSIRQITENKKYLVKVKAKNIAGVSQTPEAYVLPAAATQIKITNIEYATNGVSIAWYCDSAVAEVTLNIENTIIPLTENPYFLTTLKQNKIYKASLRAKNVSGKIDSQPYEVLPMVPGGVQLDISEEKGLQWVPMSDVEAKYTLMVDDKPLDGPLRLKENRSRKVYVLAENKTAAVRSNVVTLWPARPGEIIVDYQRLYEKEPVLSWTMKSGQEVVYSLTLASGDTIDNIASPYFLQGIDRSKSNVLFLRAKNVSGVREKEIIIESDEESEVVINRVGEVIVEPRNHVNDNKLKWYMTRGEGVFDIEEVDSGKRIENVLSGYKMIVAKPTDIRVVARGEYGEVKSNIIRVYPGIPGPIHYIYKNDLLEWFSEYGAAYYTLYDEEGSVIQEGVTSPYKSSKKVKKIEGKSREGLRERRLGT